MLSNVNSALFLVGVTIQFPAPPYAPKSKKTNNFLDKGAKKRHFWVSNDAAFPVYPNTKTNGSKAHIGGSSTIQINTAK